MRRTLKAGRQGAGRMLTLGLPTVIQHTLRLPTMQLLAATLLLAMLPTLSMEVRAQEEPRLRTNAYMIGVGVSDILDTYLSQEHFSGTGITYLATSERSRRGKDWSTLIQHQAHLALADDRAKQFSDLEMSYQLLWGRLHQWQLLDGRLRLQAGGVASALVGFIYNTHQGNNPAQARLALQLMPAATAAYSFRLFRLPATLRYELELPLAGILFSPNYGQSYYEIFSRGDYDHNIVPVTFVTAPDFRQLLTLDLGIGKKTSLRLGYLGDCRQAKVNSLRQHVYSHRFMLGIVKNIRIL